MKDRLGHNLKQTWTSARGIVKCTDADIQGKAHVDMWEDTHPNLVQMDPEYYSLYIRYAAVEKQFSFEEGFNRALELVKNGAIDIDEFDTSKCITVNSSITHNALVHAGYFEMKKKMFL